LLRVRAGAAGRTNRAPKTQESNHNSHRSDTDFEDDFQHDAHAYRKALHTEDQAG
jgi:hypothetical protein